MGKVGMGKAGMGKAGMGAQALHESEVGFRTARQFQIDLSRHPASQAARVKRVMKIGDGAVLCNGVFRGKPVVFKKFLGAKAAEFIENSRVELDYLEHHLPHPFYANRCVATLPEIGVIVLSHVPGIQVGNAIAAATGPARDEVLGLAGRWLGACIELRSQLQPFRTRRRLESLEVLKIALADPWDQALLDDMFIALRRMAHGLGGKPILHAVAHSDLVPANLFYWAGRIYAVDIQESNWFPAARPAARFLVGKDILSRPTRGDLALGLDARHANLFLHAAGLSGSSPEFRFFVAEQLVRKFLNGHAKSWDLGHARTRMQAFLAEEMVGFTDRSLP